MSEKRPSFQFYPADWRKDLNLRRCTLEERGAWMEVLCLLHESEQYGILRWELKEIAQVSGIKLKILRQLSVKNVLKGGDRNVEQFIYAPRHAGKEGEPVVLIEACDGPCWYSARFVRDEYVRLHRGASTRFQKNDTPEPIPNNTPTQRYGERQGYGSSSSSSSSTTVDKEKNTSYSKRKNFIPPGLEEIKAYFNSHGKIDQDAELFFNHYEANGWKVGKAKMVKWTAAANNWMTNRFGGNQQPRKIGGFNGRIID